MECEVFRDIGKCKKERDEELGKLDHIGENRELTADGVIKRDECSHNLERILFQEEMS